MNNNQNNADDAGIFQLDNGYWGYYGTRLAMLNTPMHILCRQMGHASGIVTQKYYLGSSRQGVDKFTFWLFGTIRPRVVSSNL